ncbi:hypothetical protein [Arsenicibacter rosenii]|nr:hypothetical protein [Arsenicibacter rosenii]
MSRFRAYAKRSGMRLSGTGLSCAAKDHLFILTIMPNRIFR